MYWYALEPLADVDTGRALALATQSKVPPLLAFTVRRIGSSGEPEAVALLVRDLAKSDNNEVQLLILRGLRQALKGRRQVAMPAEWAAPSAKLASSNVPEIRREAQALAVTFGDPKALEQTRQRLISVDTELDVRKSALASLLEARDHQLAPVLQKLIREPALRGAALRGLAGYDDPQSPAVIIAAYASLSPSERRDALNTLASRAGYGMALLDAIAAKKVAANEVPADIIRQLRILKDMALDKRIADVWGIVRDTPADRARLMAQYRRMITRPSPTRPDLALGRALYVKTCAQCHVLFGVGGKVGPDLTGSNRVNLDYLLENILDPSAVIPKEYTVTLLTLTNGRVITGIVREETDAALSVVTANETLTIPRVEIESRTPTSQSMMPDDQLKPMSDDDVRALIAYLQTPSQVPLLATADNVKDFFNGKDLTGWDGDAKLWKVENGEIVGRSPGLKHNEFLKSLMVAGNFRLTLKVKLVPNAGNSGVQFRSEALPQGEVRGYQADIGVGWWGKLYEENGRGLLTTKSGEEFVKPDEWNEYEIVAVGSRIKTSINGKRCVDIDDAFGARRGIFAFQIHSGDPMEVRFKDLQLELNPAKGR
jgi:putative heme-binding domain-containing protein